MTMLEQEYICWRQDQTEADGKEIKAPNIEAAARKALDIWLNENLLEFGEPKVTVLVRDMSDDIRKVQVPNPDFRDSPQAEA